MKDFQLVKIISRRMLHLSLQSTRESIMIPYQALLKLNLSKFCHAKILTN